MGNKEQGFITVEELSHPRETQDTEAVRDVAERARQMVMSLAPQMRLAGVTDEATIERIAFLASQKAVAEYKERGEQDPLHQIEDALTQSTVGAETGDQEWVARIVESLERYRVIMKAQAAKTKALAPGNDFAERMFSGQGDNVIRRLLDENNPAFVYPRYEESTDFRNSPAATVSFQLRGDAREKFLQLVGALKPGKNSSSFMLDLPESTPDNIGQPSSRDNRACNITTNIPGISLEVEIGSNEHITLELSMDRLKQLIAYSE